MVARPIWRQLFMQTVRFDFSLALARAGKSIAARIAMMAMTTRSSIRVKAPDNSTMGFGSPRLALVFINTINGLCKSLRIWLDAVLYKSDILWDNCDVQNGGWDPICDGWQKT